ncbi:MAG: hypothetical protein AAF108_11730 [Planctomycetota bacterium]
MTSVRVYRLITLLGLLVSACVGCAARSRAPESQPELVVTLSDAIGPDRAFFVDMLPANAAGGSRVAGHFERPRRNDAGRLTFAPGGPRRWSVGHDSPAFDRWREMGVRRLAVRADIPGRFVDLPSAQDPRQLIIDFDETPPPVRVEIGLSGVVLVDFGPAEPDPSD